MNAEKLSALRNELERAIFKIVKDSAESAYDKTNLYARRKNLPIDPNVLNDVLAAMRSSIVSDIMNKLDSLHAVAMAEVVKVLEQENPTLRKRSVGKGEVATPPAL